jgi:hypothetical protein
MKCNSCNALAPLARPGQAWKRRLHGCAVLGGFDFELGPGEPVHLVVETERLVLDHDQRGVIDSIQVRDLSAFEIFGPGAVTTGGGFFGGGFGVVGAAAGIAVAAALNAITTRTKIITLIRIATGRRELFLHYGELEPGALRIELSPLIVNLESP